MGNSRIIIFAGVPCSGRTTLLKSVHELYPDIKIVDYGKMMLREAASNHITRDQLRKLPIEEQMFYAEAAARRIAEHARGTIIIDTNVLVKTAAGYVPGFPRDVVDELLPFAIVLVHADPKLIAERREQNADSRHRDVETVEEIALHQQANLAFATGLSALNGTLLKIIMNDSERSPIEVAKELEPLLKGDLVPQ